MEKFSWQNVKKWFNMNGKKTKRLKKEFRLKFGRYPMKAQYDIRGNVISKDEFRMYKKQHGN